MERSCEPMNKNRIEGAAEQGERAMNREALVIKARRRRSGGCAVKECVLTWGDPLTAGFTPLRLDHDIFAESCPLALLGNAFYPLLVLRLAVSLHASFLQSVAIMQLRFASFAVINLRWDLHPQECARHGRTLAGASPAAS